MIILRINFILIDSIYLSDLIISILANLTSIFHDKETKTKPFLALKFVFATLCKKEIIPSYYKNLGNICERLKDSSITDLLTLIFNFLLQFQTLTQKNANSIQKKQMSNYQLNLKAILIDEIGKIGEDYLKFIFIFNH